MRNQRGITLMGLLIASVVTIIVAIGGLKIAPAYIEYFKVKKAVSAIAQAGSGATVADVRRSFDLRAAVDDIDVITGKDLEVTKEGNELVVTASYSKRISLFGNVNVVIDFVASNVK